MSKLIYVCDDKRHLICVPYSLDNLHLMANELGIKRCWFHKNHYDIPKKMIDDVTKVCVKISTRLIIDIIKRPDLASELICDRGEIAEPKDHFIVTQLKIDGQDKPFKN